MKRTELWVLNRSLSSRCCPFQGTLTCIDLLRWLEDHTKEGESPVCLELTSQWNFEWWVALFGSGVWKGGSVHPKLNIAPRPIENKYREGKVKRTLKRELKVPETVEFEASSGSLIRARQISVFALAEGEFLFGWLLLVGFGLLVIFNASYLDSWLLRLICECSIEKALYFFEVTLVCQWSLTLKLK